MGVVHKLKPEVIQFILDQKKENPKMGCRKLADLVSETFQKKISKSSVSTILKDAELSSGVGRPVDEAIKEKKFEIPKEKKEQIRESLSSLVGEGSGERPKLIPDPIEEPILKEAPADAFLAMVQGMQQKRKAAQERPFTGAGALLLMSHYWARFQKAPLGPMLERHLQGQTVDDQDLVLEALVALSLSGYKNADKVDEINQLAFWQTTTVTPAQFKEKWAGIAADWKPTPALMADYLTEREQAFKDVGGFELQFKDESKIFMDAQQCSLWNQAHAGLVQSVDCSLDEMAQRVVGQTRHFIGQTLSYQSEISGAQKKTLLNCLDPDKYPLKGITVLDIHFKELAQFEQITQTPRPFIFGLYPTQKEFKEATANIQWAGKTPYYHALFDEILELTDTLTKIEGYEVRLVCLWGSDSRPQGAFLSNDHEMSVNELVQRFLERRPHFTKTEQFESIFKNFEENRHPNQEAIDLLLKEEADRGVTSEATLWDMAWDFKEALGNHFWQTYASEEISYKDVSSFISSICRLEGGIQKEDQATYVYLDIPANHPHNKWIQRAIFSLNQQHSHTDKNQNSVVIFS